MGDTHSIVHLVIQFLKFKIRKFFHMVNVYMLLSKIISCTPIKPNNIIHMKCALDLCDEFLEYIIPDEDLYNRPNSPLFDLSVYTCQGVCAKHGIIPNVPTLCKLFK